MGVVDSLHIAGLDVTISRQMGPLEVGQFDVNTHTWTPALNVTDVPCCGFGVTAGGAAYFQSSNADPGEEADVIVDGQTGRVFVQAERG